MTQPPAGDSLWSYDTHTSAKLLQGHAAAPQGPCCCHKKEEHFSAPPCMALGCIKLAPSTRLLPRTVASPS
eukprot:m.173943 g.173943  ORF g.173943 m.173943 type:complete len:71 (-) comp17881_c1_seq5:625-837(-)